MHEKGFIPAKITWDDQFIGEVVHTFMSCKLFYWFLSWLYYSQISSNSSAITTGNDDLARSPQCLDSELEPYLNYHPHSHLHQLHPPGLRNKEIHFTPIMRIYTSFLVPILLCCRAS